MKKIILVIFACFLFILPVKAEENIVNIYLFHSNTCSHCKEEIKFLETLEQKYSNVRIYKYEISDENNQEIINKVKKLYKLEMNSVPLTIIGDKYYTGYSEEKTPSKLVATVKYYSEFGYKDKLGEAIGIGNIELPKKEITEDQISVDEYIEQNSSYNIILNISSDEIDINTSASLLGMKSSINIINIILLIALTIFIEHKKDKKEKIIAYLIYGLLAISFEILDSIIKKNLNLTIFCIAYLIFSIILVVFSPKNKHIIKYIPIAGILGIIQIIKNIIGISEISTLNKILELNLSSIFNVILNNIVYIFSYISLNVLILLLMNKIVTKKEIVVK